jgi:membrane-bound lytic murein transglycosylase A
MCFGPPRAGRAVWPATVSVLLAAAFPFGAAASGAQQRGQPPASAQPAQKNSISVIYRTVSFADLPWWESDDHAAALGAFAKSCERILSASRAGTFVAKSAPQPEFLAACQTAIALAGRKSDGKAARAFFETHFAPHRVLHAGADGLLTGYYEPMYEGSRKREGIFQVPVYRRPADLVTLVDEAQAPAPGQTMTHARKTAAGTQPYPSRAQIDAGALAGKGLELIYMKDSVDLFFMQIQGSARIKLTDGSIIRVAYDGKNGHPYTSIGRYLIEHNIMPADKVSLDALAMWLKADPERGRRVMVQNASYVFFREQSGSEAQSALGVLKIPLTPGRSLAVDPAYHALGLPIYVSSATLKHVDRGNPFHRLMISQDVGSAIKGPERGDIYFGSGTAAGKLAGVTKHPGNLFVLLPVRGGGVTAGVGAAAAGTSASKARQAKP